MTSADPAAEAVSEHIGGWQPTSWGDVGQLVSSMPNFWDALAGSLNRAADRLDEASVLRDDFAEELRRQAGVVAGLAEAQFELNNRWRGIDTGQGSSRRGPAPAPAPAPRPSPRLALWNRPLPPFATAEERKHLGRLADRLSTAAWARYPEQHGQRQRLADKLEGYLWGIASQMRQEREADD